VANPLAGLGAAAAFFVAFRPANDVVDALGTLVLAVAAMGAGFVQLVESTGATLVVAG
jgi:hypothetical protein